MGDGNTYWRPRWLVQVDESGRVAVTERSSSGPDVLAHPNRPPPHVHKHEAFDPGHTQPRVLGGMSAAGQFLDDYSSRTALEEAMGSAEGKNFLRASLNAGAGGAFRCFRLQGRYPARFVFRDDGGIVRTSDLGSYASGIAIKLYGVSETMAYVQTMFPLDELSLAQKLAHQ